MKLYFYIVRPDMWEEGDNFIVRTVLRDTPEGWMFVGEYDVDVEISQSEITEQAIKTIDAEIKDERAKRQMNIERLETRKASLLALEHKS